MVVLVVVVVGRRKGLCHNNLCDTGKHERMQSRRRRQQQPRERATEKWKGGENHVVFLLILQKLCYLENTARYRSWAELALTKRERDGAGGGGERERERERGGLRRSGDSLFYILLRNVSLKSFATLFVMGNREERRDRINICFYGRGGESQNVALSLSLSSSIPSFVFFRFFFL